MTPTNNTIRKALKIIQNARALITKAENWIQQDMALDDDDYPVSAASEWASKFCAVGALGRAAGVPAGSMGDGVLSIVISSEAYQLARVTLSRFATTDPRQAELGGVIAEFNDTHTHQEVLDMFDGAISCLEKQLPTI